jgi:hypothetical protein
MCEEQHVSTLTNEELVNKAMMTTMSTDSPLFVLLQGELLTRLNSSIPLARAHRREGSWQVLKGGKEGKGIGKCPLTDKGRAVAEDDLSHDIDEPDWLERMRSNTVCKHGNIVCDVKEMNVTWK